LLALPVIWWSMKRIGKFGHSQLDNVPKSGSFLTALPRLVLALSFIALCVALARPQRIYYESTSKVEGRDIVIAIDKSGSMSSPLPGELPAAVTGQTDLDRDIPPIPKKPDDGAAANAQSTANSAQTAGNALSGSATHTRIEVAQEAVRDFIRNRYLAHQGDRIGVLRFDLKPYWSWPLTSDLREIYRALRFADQSVGGGTNFGSFGHGPIDEAVDHFGELGQARSKVIIMVTDGEDYIDSFAMDRLTSKINDNHIMFYVIGVGETLANQNVDIMRLANLVGGRVFRVERAGDLKAVMDSIDAMERSPVSVAGSEQREELFPPFALAAILLLALAALLEALVINS
jgi:Ca-activated chloride channel family protein